MDRRPLNLDRVALSRTEPDALSLSQRREVARMRRAEAPIGSVMQAMSLKILKLMLLAALSRLSP